MRKELIKNLSAVLPHGFGLLSALLFPLLLCGCIHQYPEVASTESAPVSLTLNVEVDAELSVYQTVSRSVAEIGVPRRRFIIDVYRDGAVLPEKRVRTTDAELSAEGVYTITVPLRLEPLAYTLAVWSDYVKEGAENDWHFDTADFSGILIRAPYDSDYSRRAAYCGTAAVDLTTCANEEGTDLRQHILLKSPQAKFVLIGTDVQEFAARRRASGSYRAKVSYEYFFPTGYNVGGNVVCQSKVGISFTTPCRIEADENGECELAGDFVFAGPDASYISLTFEILDEADRTVSRVTGVQVPYKQGCLTIVKGKFLTRLMSSGVNIDTGYDGEYNIDITSH